MCAPLGLALRDHILVRLGRAGERAAQPLIPAARRLLLTVLVGFVLALRRLHMSIKAKSSVWFMRGDADADVESIRQGTELLHNESDRSVAIIGGTIVELTLTAALRAFLHRDEKLTQELLVRTEGALGMFTTKIHLGFLVGMYGKDAHRDLITMKDIRNHFAHKLSVRDFKSQKIKAWCQNLKLVEIHTADSQRAGLVESSDPRATRVWIGIHNRSELLKDPRERYLLSAQVFCAALSTQVRTAMPEPLF
jgi:hypothetical protein